MANCNLESSRTCEKNGPSGITLFPILSWHNVNIAVGIGGIAKHWTATQENTHTHTISKKHIDVFSNCVLLYRRCHGYELMQMVLGEKLASELRGCGRTRNCLRDRDVTCAYISSFFCPRPHGQLALRRHTWHSFHRSRTA